ncbi:hypothetical protein AB0942_09505 [Streptomyces nodosus]|uniref:hypothetical protein n=1 Tax=Streptomyces nodosus TaxID=40318 RepID=UPI003457289F
MDPHTLYGVDLSRPAAPLDMQVWMDDRDSMPRVVFAATHRVETIATGGGHGPDPHLHGLATGGWAKFDDFAGWAEPAPGWTSVLDVPADVLTVTGPNGAPFYAGSLNSSKAWRRTARRNAVFLALAGDISSPLDIAGANARAQMYALLCPITLT